MSNTKTALVVLGAFAALVVSFGMTYAVHQYGSGGTMQQSPETHLIEEDVEVPDGD